MPSLRHRYDRPKREAERLSGNNDEPPCCLSAWGGGFLNGAPKNIDRLRVLQLPSRTQPKHSPKNLKRSRNGQDRRRSLAKSCGGKSKSTKQRGKWGFFFLSLTSKSRGQVPRKFKFQTGDLVNGTQARLGMTSETLSPGIFSQRQHLGN